MSPMGKTRSSAAQHLGQPPTLKTKRSNAVHSRRLEIQVSALERCVAAMETERVRIVHRLHEELRHLRIPKRWPPMSPPPRRNLRNSDLRFSEERQTNLPRLTQFDQQKTRRADLDHQKSTVDQANQVSDKLEESLLVSSNLTSVTNKSNAHCYARPSELETGPYKLVDNKVTSNGNGTALAGESHPFRKGTVILSKTTGCGSMSAPKPYTTSLSFKGDSTQKTIKSHPTSGQIRNQDVASRGSSQRQHQIEDDDQGRAHASEHLQGPESSGDYTFVHRITVKIKRTGSADLKPVLPNASGQKQTHSSDTEYMLPGFPTESPLTSKRTGQRPERLNVHKLCPLAGIPCSSSCGHFPCVQPQTYHSLGFHPDASTHPWRGWLAQNALRPHHRLVSGRQTAAADPKGRRTPADSPGYVKRKKKGKEDVVRLEMARKKRMLALARPPSWNTNYGEPTPYRRLKYPVRLVPLS